VAIGSPNAVITVASASLARHAGAGRSVGKGQRKLVDWKARTGTTEYTQLGPTDLRVSRLCFGTWSFADEWDSVQVDQGKAAVGKALDLGITFFDTAQAYGFGASERMLGQALRPETTGRRPDVVLATKGGLRREGGQTVRDASPAWPRQGLEASLRFLGTDYLGLYQLHWPNPQRPIDQTARALDAFGQGGRIRYVGVSNFDARQMLAFARTRRIDALQPPYHLFRRDIEASILPYCQEYGIGVLVYGPLAHGLLAGGMTAATTFPADDWRSNSDDFRGDAFRTNLAIVDELKRFAEPRGYTVGQVAIAWTLANPAVDVAIVGARNPKQIEETVPAAEIHLTAADLAVIDRITRAEIPVGGPATEFMPTTTGGSDAPRCRDRRIAGDLRHRHPGGAVRLRRRGGGRCRRPVLARPRSGSGGPLETPSVSMACAERPSVLVLARDRAGHQHPRFF
jgi:aryl-alcohol dehydrogenase-like predicted oxidoreductase